MTCRTRAARTIAPVVLLSIARLASAQEVRTGPQWWGNVNPASYHLGDEDEFLAPGEDFNQEHYGGCGEHPWKPRHAVATGY